MIKLKKIDFIDLDDQIQFIIERELIDQYDKGLKIENLFDVKISLRTYDASIEDDYIFLKNILNNKINEEGLLNEGFLNFYRENLELLKRIPLVIVNDYCAEGKHRLAVALELKEKVNVLYL